MLTRYHIAYLAAIFLLQLLTSVVVAVENPAVPVSGVVQDRNGEPIRGARVFVINGEDEWSMKTGEDGAFEMKELPASGTLLFIEGEGFRFHGERLTETSKPLVRQLTRIADPTTDNPLAGSDWEIPRDERLKLVHRVFEPYLEHVVVSEIEDARFESLELMAKIDPTRTLKLLQQYPLRQRHLGIAVRNKVIEERARVNVKSAIEMVEHLNHPYVSGNALIRITQFAPDMPKPDAIALLSRAADDAKSVKNLAQRIALLGLVADALLDAGERATAEELLRGAQRQAGKVANPAWAGFARSSFAKALAQIDVDAALPLVTELPDDIDHERYLGNIAHELAAINPAEAARVLNMIKRPENSRQAIDARDRYAVRVCYRMATKDLARAIKIAESCDERNQQAYAHGVIAHAIAIDDRAQATKLLRQAYDLLKDGNRDPQSFKIHSAQIAGCLLRTAEHIDPTLVQEMIWRTVSLRTPSVDSEPWSNQQTSQLASWLSRHDRALARTVLDHWHSGTATQSDRDQYATALTLVDPMRAVEFAESQDKDNTPNRTRFAIARALMADGEDRIRIPHREAGLWPIDAEDSDW